MSTRCWKEAEYYRKSGTLEPKILALKGVMLYHDDLVTSQVYSTGFSFDEESEK